MKWVVCDLPYEKPLTTEEVRENIHHGVIKKETRIKKMGSPIARKASDILEFSLEWSTPQIFTDPHQNKSPMKDKEESYSFIKNKEFHKENSSIIIKDIEKETNSWKITIQEVSHEKVVSKEKAIEQEFILAKEPINNEELILKEELVNTKDPFFLRPTLQDDGFEITFLEKSSQAKEKKIPENEVISIENKRRLSQGSSPDQKKEHVKIVSHKKIQHTHKKPKISRASPRTFKKYGKGKYAYIIENSILLIVIILVISTGFLLYQRQNAKNQILPPYQKIETIIPEAQLELPHTSLIKELQEAMSSSTLSSFIASTSSTATSHSSEIKENVPPSSRAIASEKKPTPRPSSKLSTRTKPPPKSSPFVRNKEELHQNLQKNIQISFVRYNSLKENCKPCHVQGRLLDGTSLILVTFQYSPWKGLSSSGNVQITGQVLRKQGNDYWIMVHTLSKR